MKNTVCQIATILINHEKKKYILYDNNILVSRNHLEGT